MPMKNIFGISLLCVLLALASCKRYDPVSQIHTFTNVTWERFEHLNFELPVEDLDTEYDISVIVKHTAKFPAEALAVNVVMVTPGGEERIKDYTLILKDRDGNYIGYETDGIYNCIIKIRQGMRFQETGMVKFEIENLMTKYYTPGIIEFGILLEKAKEER
jgi:gliding motility-associated lipoprotein GldH